MGVLNPCTFEGEIIENVLKQYVYNQCDKSIFAFGHSKTKYGMLIIFYYHFPE
jgi:hypothetical protein